MSWLKTYKEEILQQLPELKQQFLETETRINKANCPKCVRNKHEARLKREIAVKTKPGMFSAQLEVLLTPYSPTLKRKRQLQTTKKPPISQVKNVAKRVSTSEPKEPSEMTVDDERQGCIDCVRKHLSQAIILLRECNQGYGTDEFEHKWLAIGHLAEAADEALQIDEKLSNSIRDIRLVIMEQGE